MRTRTSDWWGLTLHPSGRPGMTASAELGSRADQSDGLAAPNLCGLRNHDELDTGLTNKGVPACAPPRSSAPPPSGRPSSSPSAPVWPRPQPRRTATPWRPCVPWPSTGSTPAAPRWSPSTAPASTSPWRPRACWPTTRTRPTSTSVPMRVTSAPRPSDDAKGDGTLNTTDGGPAYGPIVVSLTKTGDTSPDSGLAVDRFDTAPGGKISYERGSINGLLRRRGGHRQGSECRRRPRRGPQRQRQVRR